MTIKAIFAAGMKGEFANTSTGFLPWGKRKPLHGDGKHFMQYTRGAVVLMGHETWKSLPVKLPNRLNVVLSRGIVSDIKGERPDIVLSGSLDQILPELQQNNPDKDIIIIGGKALIEQSIHLIDELSWTTVFQSYEDCVSIDVSSMKHELFQKDFRVKEVHTFQNETFGLGDNLAVQVYRRYP